MPDADRECLSTEAVHPLSAGLDTRPLEEAVRLLSEEQQGAMKAIDAAFPQIVAVARAYAKSYQAGGRVLYVGAGTSGRLGLLDTAELPETFGIAPGRIQTLLAGGEAAMSQAIESAEDDATAGQQAIAAYKLDRDDLVIGISASGETPFVLGAVAEANSQRAVTVGITNNVDTTLEQVVDLPIIVATGPELITGSTRLKAGTAQKVVLNLLSTAAMVSVEKVYDGFMIEVRPMNAKLRRRAMRTLEALTDKSPEVVHKALVTTGWQVKPALLMIKAHITRDKAKRLLEDCRGSLRGAMKALDIE